MEAVRGPAVVDGWGPLADEVCAQLRRCRVPLRSGAHAADAAELAAVDHDEVPALVLLVSEGREPLWLSSPSLGAPWHAAGVPVLPVTGGDRRAVVGPLVVPGRTACLACVGASAPRQGPGALDPAAVVLASAVAVVTTLAVRAGDLSLGSVSTEVGPRGTTVLHRVWTSRPGCGCASVRMAG